MLIWGWGAAAPAEDLPCQQEDDSWSDDLGAIDEAEAHEDSSAPAWIAANGTRRSLKRLHRASEVLPEAATGAGDCDAPKLGADASPTARLPKQVLRCCAGAEEMHRHLPF